MTNVENLNNAIEQWQNEDPHNRTVVFVAVDGSVTDSKDSNMAVFTVGRRHHIVAAVEQLTENLKNTEQVENKITKALRIASKVLSIIMILFALTFFVSSIIRANIIMIMLSSIILGISIHLQRRDD